MYPCTTVNWGTLSSLSNRDAFREQREVGDERPPPRRAHADTHTHMTQKHREKQD